MRTGGRVGFIMVAALFAWCCSRTRHAAECKSSSFGTRNDYCYQRPTGIQLL